MNAQVRVLEVDDYEAWLDGQMAEPSGEAAERGEEWAQQFGCIACHTLDGSQGVGPTWSGLFDSERLLEDGTTVIANDQYLRESILNPGAKIVDGYQNIMPSNFSDQMDDEKIDDVIAFIKSLQQ
jgi:cytochrome c oxidase subunit 2